MKKGITIFILAIIIILSYIAINKDINDNFKLIDTVLIISGEFSGKEGIIIEKYDFWTIDNEYIIQSNSGERYYCDGYRLQKIKGIFYD